MDQCGDQLVFEKNRQNVKNVCVDIGNNDLGKTANHFWKSIVIIFFMFSVESPIFWPTGEFL